MLKHRSQDEWSHLQWKLKRRRQTNLNTYTQKVSSWDLSKRSRQWDHDVYKCGCDWNKACTWHHLFEAFDDSIHVIYNKYCTVHTRRRVCSGVHLTMCLFSGAKWARKWGHRNTVGIQPLTVSLLLRCTICQPSKHHQSVWLGATLEQMFYEWRPILNISMMLTKWQGSQCEL